MVALIAVLVAAVAGLSTPAIGQSTNETPAATEVGVTPTEIHIAVVADVNVFAGVRDAVLGFENYVNGSCATKNRCVAGRKLVVDVYDSKLDHNESRNATIQACNNDFAMVGTAAVFLDTVDDMRSCKDRAGATTGIPDIPVLAAPIVQQCSDQSFPIVAPVVECSTKGEHPQKFAANAARGYYFLKKYHDLHGIYVVTSDSQIGYIDQLAGFGALEDIGGHGHGIRSDGNPKVSLTTAQDGYTSFVETMKNAHSNYGQCAQTFTCTVLLRREANLQGITNQVKVWDCSEQCYDTKFLKEGGTDVAGEYVDLLFLPFYDLRDQKSNPMLANFVRFTGTDKVDGFGDNAWAAAVAFRDAVNAEVQAHGVNGLTRANLFSALNRVHNFNADGMIAPIDLAGRKPTDCHILTQVRNGAFVQVEPTKPGKFDCSKKYVVKRKLDLFTGS